MIQNIVGPPVRGDDFFDRVDELQTLWQRLERQNVLLLAPRRVGKTSLLYRLLRDAAAKEHLHAIYFSVPDIDTELAFVQRLYEQVALAAPDALKPLQRARQTPLGRFVRRIKSIGVSGVQIGLQDVPPDEWRTVGAELIAAMRATRYRWIIAVDELPLFVMELLKIDSTGLRARNFLHWLRDLRQGPLQVEDSLRWVLAGSIGLDTVTRRYRMGDAINDLHIMHIGPFSKENADRFLQELSASAGLQVAPDSRRRLSELAGWRIPYHLQLLFSMFHDLCRERRTTNGSPELAEEAFELLLEPSRRAYFDYWTQRLVDELGAPHEARALLLLKACAAQPTGASRESLRSLLGMQMSDVRERDDELSWLLDVLQADGYLVEADGRFGFRAELLRRFFLRRFE